MSVSLSLPLSVGKRERRGEEAKDLEPTHIRHKNLQASRYKDNKAYLNSSTIHFNMAVNYLNNRREYQHWRGILITPGVASLVDKFWIADCALKHLLFFFKVSIHTLSIRYG